MTRCAYVESRLRALADGELEPGENRKVLEHLDGCAQCRAGFARVQAVAAALQEQELEDVPAHFTASLQVRLARHRKEREEKATRRGWRAFLDRIPSLSLPARPVRWAGAMTAVVAATVCMFAFSRGIQAEEVARRAGERWKQIRNYGCVFVSTGYYQGQPRTFRQSQFYRKSADNQGPGEFRLETEQDYPLTTFVQGDRVMHYLPGGDWKGHGPLVIVRPRKEDQNALPFPFGVTWQNGGNVSLDQLVRQLGQNDEEAKLIGEEKVGDRECYRLSFQAVPPGGTVRDQYELWIDKESFLPRRVSWYRDEQNHIVTEAQQLQVNYDVVPAGTFDFQIPDGAAVIQGDVDPHVLALKMVRLNGVSYDRDPIESAEAEGWSRQGSVPFPVQAPRSLPDGFELLRVRRKVGRWVDMHWIRSTPSGPYQVIKLVQQDGALEWKDGFPDAREITIPGGEKPIKAKVALRDVPYKHLSMSWRQGGTRFILTAAGLNLDEARQFAGSMRPVTRPVRRTTVAQHGPRYTRPIGEPSELPALPTPSASEEASSVEPAAPEPAVVPSETAVEQQQPPMMPEMADDETVREPIGATR